ncbi:flagellin [Iodidimonas muriae]|uniref:Flagellin n=1 Tax=Iodidimonas muriae TaxID=261467 RepID=A0ABQ2LHQ5_9PROT|nr:flagellin [Iodidimonas muriae]GER08305.1 flagellin [Kordiimonadales bacterium JCM 17843]GGO16350.1 flagellin [Iodidimonas muriae]
MTRISSFGQSSLLLQNTMRNQERLFTVQQQISTGKKANDFQSLGPDIQQALSARQARSGVESFRSTVQNVQRSVDVYDAQLTSIVDAARELKSTLVSTVGQGNAQGFTPFIEQTFGLVSSALNTKLNGSYIFGGAKTDQSPLTVTNLSDLVPLVSPQDAFANDGAKKQALVAEGVTLEFGQVADDVALELMASFKRIAEFNAGPDGPLDGQLTAAQEDFLIREMAQIDQAVDQAQSAQTRNGLVAGRLATVDEQHADAEVFFEQFVSDVEDVNLAEAITRLNQDQVALEASFQAIGTLSRLSLLNFL